jgi:hypothetical protein
MRVPTAFCVCAIGIVGLVLLTHAISHLDDICMNPLVYDGYVQIEVQEFPDFDFVNKTNFKEHLVYMDTYCDDTRSRNHNISMDK